jgi:two-component system response regulator PilR (NtrC family)
MRYRILFISGRPADARHLSQMLHSLPVDLDRAEDLEHACKLLDTNAYQVILTEADLPDGSWLDVLEAAGGFAYKLPVIVTDPQADARLWAEVLNQGGYDLLTQPFYAPEVRRILGNAVNRGLAMAAV